MHLLECEYDRQENAHTSHPRNMKCIIKYIENILPKTYLKLYYEYIRNILKIHSKYIKKYMKNILQIYY